jgi:hypothetical protein
MAFKIHIWIDMADLEYVEDNGILYLDAYIALHNAIRCVEYLMQTQSGEILSPLADLGNDLDSYHVTLRNHLGEDAEGDLFAQRVEVNADRELPAYLPRDPRMIVNQIIGGYLLEAIGGHKKWSLPIFPRWMQDRRIFALGKGNPPLCKL